MGTLEQLKQRRKWDELIARHDYDPRAQEELRQARDKAFAEWDQIAGATRDAERCAGLVQWFTWGVVALVAFEPPEGAVNVQVSTVAAAPCLYLVVTWLELDEHERRALARQELEAHLSRGPGI